MVRIDLDKLFSMKVPSLGLWESSRYSRAEQQMDQRIVESSTWK